MSEENWNLGRFIRVRERIDGTHRVFMEVPERFRPEGWEPSIPLPQLEDRRGSLHNPVFKARVVREAKALNQRLDARRAAAEVAKTERPFGRRALPELAEIYFKTLRFKRLSEGRKARMRSHIKKILRWSKIRGHPEFATLFKPDIEDFLAVYDDRPFQQLDFRSLWHILCREAVSAGWRADIPTADIAWTAPPPALVRVWKEDDAKAYAQMARQMGQPGLAALLEVQMFVGQRLGDVRLAKHGANYVGGRMLLRQSKGGRRVGPALPKHLRDLIESVRLEGSPYLFNDFDTGTAFTQSRIHTRFAEIRHALATEGEEILVLRSLRHSAVCRMVKAGVPLSQLRAVTGHKQQTINQIVERYAVDLEGFADEAMKTLNRADGGSDEDFVFEDQEYRDWVGDDDRRRLYAGPREDPERAGRYLAALLGQHRDKLSLPRELMPWGDDDEQPPPEAEAEEASETKADKEPEPA